VVTSAPGAVSPSNFGDLTLGTVIKVTLDFGNGTVVVFSVSIEDVVTVQQVVDAVNAAYQAATLALADGTEFNRASVPVPVPGPYVFTDPATRDSFFVSFNGNVPIHINPPAGEYSASSFATYVNNQIGAASQVTEGEAVALALTAGDPARAVFRSKNFSGDSSSVRFLPGNPGGTVPGAFMETLDYLGVVPGAYKGTSCAALYGLDEIEFFCPSTLPGASITVEPQPPSSPGVAAGLWGLPVPSASAAVTVGQVRVAVPEVAVILPEMVEFHEEPDDYDSEIQDFDNRGDAATIDPSFGVGNVGISALLGLTGKIDPSFIPTLLDSLNLNHVNLGANRIKTATDQRAPRATYPYNPALGAVLLWEGVDVTEPSLFGLIRMYLKDGDVYLTRNAKLTDSGDWDRDVIEINSSMFEFHAGKGSFAVWKGAESAPWTHNDWQRNLTFNPFGTDDAPFREGLLSIGEFVNTSGQAILPRLDIPTQLGTPTLLFAAKASTGIVIRAYVTNTAVGNTTMLEITVNAKFNGSQWNKDVTGVQATRFDFTAQGGFQMSTKNAVNNTAWSGWDAFPVRFDPAGMINFFQYTLKLGFGATNSTSPRVSADRYSPSTDFRTLLFESPVASGANVPIRIYIDTSSTPWGGIPTPDPGDGFMFTYNAKWDQSLGKWTQDVPGYRSYAYGFLGQRLWLLSRISASAPWDDGWTNWSKYNMLELPGPGGEKYSGFSTLDGTFRVDAAGSVSNPVAATPILLNAIYAKSMIKSWGRCRYLVPNPAVLDGFNISSLANWTQWDWYVYNATPLGNGSYTVIGSLESNAGQATTNPVAMVVWGTSFSDRISIYFYDANGNWYSTTSVAAIGMHLILKATT
jgi:hypothetical protein